VALHNAALALAERTGVTELSVSMSHEQEYATATVVARIHLERR
jgi:phosphopantetheinyl transferase (holo-ACP synthase)